MYKLYNPASNWSLFLLKIKSITIKPTQNVFRDYFSLSWSCPWRTAASNRDNIVADHYYGCMLKDIHTSKSKPFYCLFYSTNDCLLTSHSLLLNGSQAASDHTTEGIAELLQHWLLQSHLAEISSSFL